jgi:DNA repair exonuclease SbcCD ATPase subunit
LAKLLNDTHQNVAGLLSNGRLDDAATAAQTAAQQNPTVRDINTMSSALKEIQNAKPAAATASKLLEDSRALVAAQAPADAKSLQEEFTSAKEKLTQQEASALEQFKARNYAGALNTAGTLSAGAVKEACRKVEAVATALDKRGDDAAKANAKFRNSVGEMGVDDSGPAKPDPKKAIPYQNAAKALRALVPPGVR